jgi:hypothetical protein
MKAVYDTCAAADIPIPRVVLEFFGDADPDDAGTCIDLKCTPWHDATHERQGFELEVSSIPSKVRTIRLYNRW